MSNINAIASKLEPLMQNSLLYPVMVEVGGHVMHLDPTEVSQEISQSIEKGTQTATQNTKELIAETLKQEIESTVKSSGH
jgi:hypothetical protein